MPLFDVFPLISSLLIVRQSYSLMASQKGSELKVTVAGWVFKWAGGRYNYNLPAYLCFYFCSCYFWDIYGFPGLLILHLICCQSSNEFYSHKSHHRKAVNSLWNCWIPKDLWWEKNLNTKYRLSYYFQNLEQLAMSHGKLVRKEYDTIHQTI